MPRITTDPNDPELTKGVDDGPAEQAEVYLVMDPATAPRIRPLRDSYIHLRTEDGGDPPYVIQSMKGLVGCGVVTCMGDAIAETYARNPTFYSHTYCMGCRRHLPVQEFSWTTDNTAVGS